MREKLKSPFRKLRHFGLSKQGAKEARASTEEGPLPSVAKCMQDAMELRIKYEGLLTNGQIIAGAAYDFSRSLQDMASYMVETFREVVDQEIGNIFSLLAKVQFEMSKLLDLFAAHVSKTIIKPTELLMTKIQQAEVMKDEYDEERKLYVLSRIEKQKGRTKRGKENMGHVVDEESVQGKANLLTSYMQSLTCGQSENLVTQAVKYHSAHMHLFSKGFASVNAIEPMIKQVALDRIIDTTLCEEIVFVDGLMCGSEINLKEKVQTNEFESDSAASSPRNLLGEQTEPPNYLSDSSEELYPRRLAVTSKSAPISPLMYHRREATGNLRESALDNECVTMYALPSPLNESGGHMGNKTSKKFERHSDLLHKRLENFAGDSLEASKAKHKSVNQHSPQKGRVVHGWQQDRSDSKVSPNKNLSFFDDGTQDDDLKRPIVEKSRRYTQSGPLVDSPSYNKPRYANVRSPMPFYEEYTPTLYKSGPISRSPLFSYTTCNLSPPPSSIPYISELHKLPLPPPGYITPPKSPNHTLSPITHSAPLGKGKQAGLHKSGQVSPLPSPALMTRSLSIPTPTIQLQDLKTEPYYLQTPLV